MLENLNRKFPNSIKYLSGDIHWGYGASNRLHQSPELGADQGLGQFPFSSLHLFRAEKNPPPSHTVPK